MAQTLVRYKVDPNNLPELTEEEIAKRKALAAMPDSVIDYSDIPPQGNKDWSNAVRGIANMPRKEEMTVVVLDADIILG